MQKYYILKKKQLEKSKQYLVFFLLFCIGASVVAMKTTKLILPFEPCISAFEHQLQKPNRGFW